MNRRRLLGLLLSLPAGAAAAASWLRPAQDDLLPVDQALRLQPALWREGYLWLGWDLAPGCYLYRDRLGVEVLQPAGQALSLAALPKGDTVHDPHFGSVQVWRGRVELKIPAATAPRRLRLRYQGCAEDRVCYPPVSRDLDVLTA